MARFSLSQWWRRLLSKSPRPSRRRPLHFDCLEDRCVPAVDILSPALTGLTAHPAPSFASPHLTAVLSDVGTGNSQVRYAEYFIGAEGEFGTGIKMKASDGNFDSPSEAIKANLPADLAPGTYTLHVHGRDAKNNWSPFVTLEVTKLALGAPDLVSGSDTGASSADNLTRDTTPTFTGTVKPNKQVTLLVNGTAMSPITADGDGVWTFTAPTLGNGDHNIKVRVQETVGGTVRQTTSPALKVTIDTTPPSAPTRPDLVAAADTGSSTTDNVTSDDTPTFSGRAAKGSLVELFEDGTFLGSAAASAATGDWEITTSALAEGVHSITARATDAAGNPSVLSGGRSVTIDLSPPAAPDAPDLLAADDSGDSNSDNLTRFTAFTVNGVVAPRVVVTLFIDGQEVESQTANAQGRYSFVTPGLDEGARAVTVVVADAAGNRSAASAALTVTVDVTPPEVTSFLFEQADDTGASNTDGVTNNPTPTFFGTAAPGVTLTLYSNGQAVDVTTAAGDGTFTLEPTLADGDYSLSVSATDAAGNEATLHYSYALRIDTTAPSAPTDLRLTAQSDSGVVHDNITRYRFIELQGLTEPFSHVTVLKGLGIWGEIDSDASGYWRLYVPTELAVGTHEFQAGVIDQAGNLSPLSDPVQIVIDPNALATPTLALDPSSDRGASDTDGLTNETTPFLFGSADPGATVTIYDEGDELGTAQADSSGYWWYNVGQPLSEGVHELTATSSLDGGTSPVSAPLSIEIDTNVPSVSAPDLSDASDSGASDTDNITNAPTPTFTGFAEEGSLIQLYHELAGGRFLVGETTADDNGEWSFTFPNADAWSGPPPAQLEVLVNTAIQFPELATEGAFLVLHPTEGNGVSLSSDVVLAYVSLNLTTETPPAVFDSAVYNLLLRLEDPLTNVFQTVTIAGMFSGEVYEGSQTLTHQLLSAPTQTVQVGNLLVTITILPEYVSLPPGPFNGFGSIGARIEVAALPVSGEGEQVFTVEATDPAGNVSLSAPLVVTYDSTAPDNPGAPALTPESDTGLPGDNVTAVTAPVLTGDAGDDVFIDVYDNGELLGSTDLGSDYYWTFGVPTDLSPGTHALVVRARDVAGNLSGPSTGTELVILAEGAADPNALAWAYSWTTPTAVIESTDRADTSLAFAANENFTALFNDSVIVAAVARLFSNAPTESPGSFDFQTWELTVALENTAAEAFGELTFTGYFEGSASYETASVTAIFDNALQSVVVADLEFTVQLLFTPPGPPRFGQTGAFEAFVSVRHVEA